MCSKDYWSRARENHCDPGAQVGNDPECIDLDGSPQKGSLLATLLTGVLSLVEQSLCKLLLQNGEFFDKLWAGLLTILPTWPYSLCSTLFIDELPKLGPMCNTHTDSAMGSGKRPLDFRLYHKA